ncbi:MAG: HD-GYP domain-containing protein, partial [Candidatus Rokuibacteriota bacterium]
GFRCVMAASYREALAAIHGEPDLDLALLDYCIPGGTGFDLLPEIRRLERWVEVVMISGQQDVEVVRQCLREGAFDYLVKPFPAEALYEAVGRALERRRLVEADLGYRGWLESRVAQQTEQLRAARDVAVLTLAELAEARDPATGRHLERIARFCRRLCAALREGPYRDQLDDGLEEHISRSSALHDIGKVAIPDAILLKPGPLTPAETAVMRTHAAIGGDILKRVRAVAGGGDFLDIGMAIAYQHHERWDGAGYPAGLAGEAIGLPARIVAIVDAYDALTSRRPYQEPVDHATAVARLAIDRGGHFDPVVTDAFVGGHEEFDRIRKRLAD